MQAPNSAISDLIKAQAACDPVLKDSTNPHFKSRYASLSSCVDACKAALHANNFAVLQANGHDEYGPLVQTTLVHTSGASWSSAVYLVLSKQDMQGLGSAITYARRYGLLGMVGLAPEDDDGNASIPAPRPQQPVQQRQAPAPAPGIKEIPFPVNDKVTDWRLWVEEQKNNINQMNVRWHLQAWAKKTTAEREALQEYDRELTAELKDHYGQRYETLNDGVR